MEEAGGKRWKGPDPPVSSDQQAIQPSELYEWVRKQTRLRAVGIVEALEEISIAQSWTANQVAFWQALALSGSRQPIVGYGRIFGLRLPVS
jgi:maleate isomerase